MRSKTLLSIALVLSLSGCSTIAGLTQGNLEARTTEPGPPISTAPIPSTWKTVSSATPLVYSVPPQWVITREKGGGSWGSGFVTSGNTIAQPGYCPTPEGYTFRAQAGIVANHPSAADQAVIEATNTLLTALDLRFTQAGTDRPDFTPVTTSVSGSLAYYVSVQARVNPPRGTCTPPIIRLDVVSVPRMQDKESSYLFILMTDEGEAGVEPARRITQVVSSLRYKSLA